MVTAMGAHRAHGERGVRACSGVQGQSLWLGGQGAKPPKDESFEAFADLKKAQKFAVSMPRP